MFVVSGRQQQWLSGICRDMCVRDFVCVIGVGVCSACFRLYRTEFASTDCRLES